MPEDLLFFYDHLRKGGGVVRVDQSLLLYRYLPDAATHSVLEYVGPGAPGVVWGPRRAWAADAGPWGQVSRTRREIWAQGRARRAEPSWGAGAVLGPVVKGSQDRRQRLQVCLLLCGERTHTEGTEAAKCARRAADLLTAGSVCPLCPH